MSLFRLLIPPPFPGPDGSFPESFVSLYFADRVLSILAQAWFCPWGMTESAAICGLCRRASTASIPSAIRA